MADLFHKQATKYAEARPGYPSDLFQFIASKTPRRRLAWDVATGSGQAAVSGTFLPIPSPRLYIYLSIYLCPSSPTILSLLRVSFRQLAAIYETVVATDTSAQQLAHAPALPNVLYRQTPPSIPPEELERHVAPLGSVDLITVAQGLHWFDLPSFYALARSALRRPGGVIAAWCYLLPRVDAVFDAFYDGFYAASKPYWAPERQLLEERYAGVEFPFEPVEGEEHTGPFEFTVERKMDLAAVLTHVRSWSAYQTARERGVDLLDAAAEAEFRRAWGGDAAAVKVARHPLYLRIGRVGG